MSAPQVPKVSVAIWTCDQETQKGGRSKDVCTLLA
jgi:hypothetical protein